MTGLTHKAIQIITLMVSSTTVMAGQSPVLNGDLPGGSGDWETHERNLTAECEITEGSYKGLYKSDDPDMRLPKGYHCISTGGRCKHSDADPEYPCVNMKVRWLWDGGSTPWFDRDRPDGNADYESIEVQLKLQCIFGTRIFYPGQVLPVGYTCDQIRGAWCENSKTQPINTCMNAPVSIRYSW